LKPIRVVLDLRERLRVRLGRGYQRAPYRARAWGYALAMVVVAGLLALHSMMMLELADRSSKTAEREAQLYAFALTERQLHRQNFVEDVMRGSEAPLLYTRMDGTPVLWRNLRCQGREIVSEVIPYAKLLPSERKAIQEFLQNSQKAGRILPIVVGGTPMGLLYHGDYNLKREMYGLLAGGAVAIVLLAGLTWFGLKIMQGTERSLLWVGLARETAHQLGTPISALVGWIEYMRLKSTDIPQMGRLARFSQIGSLPELHLQDPNTVIRSISDYFTPRLPKEDRKVVLELDLALVADIPLNRELLGWVFENLIKNALDAMDRPDGRIRITSRPTGRLEQDVRIDIEDNGRGIPTQHLRDVFLPGWTSKTRGWGLGLALAKRIVEQYHGGKIWVDYSRLGEGTGFSILLRDPSALDRHRSGAA